MFRLITEKVFLKNLLYAASVLILLFLAWLKWLEIYTNHDDLIKVPDFNGIHIKNLDSVIASYSLRYEIIDSVFDNLNQRGVVVNQDPQPYTNVKRNRNIYLTINSLKIRKVDFPDIFDLTLRQAVITLQNNGFKVGRLEYQANIATNKVLDFKVNGFEIDIGQELYYGTTIDLVVGQGISNDKVKIPHLIGLSRVEANIILKSTSLNVGMEYFYHDISDSNLAIIYSQYPESVENKEISIGSSIDLYFEYPQKEPL
jgi:beta-lactam-binding protein with PASTA domain